MGLENNLLWAAVILLVAALVAILLFQRLGLGAILGYLTAGVVVGPWGLAITEEVEQIRHASELGVVFLLFVVGLELHPAKLWQLRRLVFGLGLAQIVGTGLVLAVAGHLVVGVDWPLAILIGFGLALSSTAIGLQILGERGDMASPYGQTAFAILLMQDIAIAPLLALVPLFAGAGLGDNVGGAILVGVAALVGLVLAGRYLLIPLLRLIALTRNTEAFAGAIVAVVLASALLFEQVGLSMALGAFLIGLVLSDSAYRYQIEAAVHPFRGFLLGLFFMAVGMSIDFGVLAAVGPLFVLRVFALLVVKGIVLFALCRLFGQPTDQALRVALLLPQAGEFGFVLFGAAFTAGVMGEHAFQVILVLIAISMLITPLLAALGERLVGRMASAPMAAAPTTVEASDHVIVGGFGRVGLTVTTLLEKAGVPHVALDRDADRVAWGRSAGHRVHVGDLASSEVLAAAGVGRARLVILTMDDMLAADRALAAIRFLAPGLPIQVRVKSLAIGARLLATGATHVVAETAESSLQLGRAALLASGLPETEVEPMIAAFRQDDYALLGRLDAR
jgi:monovalent cation:proton antiporter-2 (CPA2) family protein